MNHLKRIFSIGCPSCEERITFRKRPRVGDIVICRFCDATHIVAESDPLKVKWLVFDYASYWDDKDLIDYDLGNGHKEYS